MSATNLDKDTLKSFAFLKILSENTSTGSIFLLGQIDSVPTILHLQRTPLPTSSVAGLVASHLEKLDIFLENTPYFSSHAWLSKSDVLPDLTIKIIHPATEDHIKKYSVQERLLVSETREMYEGIVKPYIASLPGSKIDWVYKILDGKKEVERVLYRTEGQGGFIILPDLKWDQSSLSSVYLTVLVQDRSIRSLRDLTRDHIALLKDIKAETWRVCNEKFGVEHGKMRLFVHYQPTYYHFHVHAVHVQSEILAGMTVGQAHLLDDLISLLELSSPAGPSLVQQMTLTYLLGEEHGLFAAMRAAQAEA
ncbi:m7GpppX diphosphatase, partial [Tremellales sp. Uapishka_1]